MRCPHCTFHAELMRCPRCHNAFNADDAEELAHLAYLRRRLDAWRAEGLLFHMPGMALYVVHGGWFVAAPDEIWRFAVWSGC